MPLSTMQKIMSLLAVQVGSAEKSSVKKPAKRTIDVIKPLSPDVSDHSGAMRNPGFSHAPQGKGESEANFEPHRGLNLPYHWKGQYQHYHISDNVHER